MVNVEQREGIHIVKVGRGPLSLLCLDPDCMAAAFLLVIKT